MAQVPSCFNAMTRLVPVVRAEAARRLVKAGLQQGRIAEHLGVSQAMVSKYLRRPPSIDGVAPAKVISELAEASVAKALADEGRGGIPAWCPVCQTLSDAGYACALQPLPKLHECLRQDRTQPANDGSRVLENLAAAAERVRRLPLHRLLPEVRTNIAMARPDAESIRDVAAFPGRLIELRGEVREIAAPEFGASTHLAEILLGLRRTQPALHAAMNLRYDDRVREALKAADLKARILRRTRGDLIVAVPAGQPVDAVIDAGAFGIEPALYVLGTSATDAVAKAERLLHVLPSEKKS